MVARRAALFSCCVVSACGPASGSDNSSQSNVRVSVNDQAVYPGITSIPDNFPESRLKTGADAMVRAVQHDLPQMDPRKISGKAWLEKIGNRNVVRDETYLDGGTVRYMFFGIAGNGGKSVICDPETNAFIYSGSKCEATVHKVFGGDAAHG